MRVRTIISSDFESLDDLPLATRIDRLGQEILANAFVTIDRIRKEGKKATKKEIEIQEDLQRQFKYIQSTYISLVKMNRITDKPSNIDFESGLLQRVKKLKSSLANIVTKVPRQ